MLEFPGSHDMYRAVGSMLHLIIIIIFKNVFFCLTYYLALLSYNLALSSLIMVVFALKLKCTT